MSVVTKWAAGMVGNANLAFTALAALFCIYLIAAVWRSR